MAGAFLIIGLVSMYLYNTYIWNYEDSKFQFQIENKVYNLKNPSQRWDMPKELKEISGLSFYNKNKLACIQDEEGYFYIYDLNKKEIFSKDQFGKKGDYEAVEIISGRAYVLESKGDIYYFDVKRKGIGEVKKIKTDLSGKNDAEGLGYAKQDKELLIACKEDPGTKKIDLEKSRSIYVVELEGMKFKKNPKYIIDGKSYSKMLEKKELSKKKHIPFKPSGLAIHPKNNYVFIISTVGKMMVILNPAGDIEELIPLDPEIFWQPEGICFSPDGDLYISSEGKGKKGYILQF